MASDTAQCNLIFNDFYRVIVNETTWSGNASATHVYELLNDVVSSKINEYINGTYPNVTELISKDLPNLDEHSAVKSAIEAAKIQCVEIFTNVTANIPKNMYQAYHDNIFDYKLNDTQAGVAGIFTLQFPLHVVESDLKRMCKQGLANADLTIETLKRYLRRIVAISQVDPANIQNVPMGFVPSYSLRPQTNDAFFADFIALNQSNAASNFSAQVSLNATNILNGMANLALNATANLNQTVQAFLKATTVVPADVVNSLLGKFQDRLDIQGEVNDTLTKALSDLAAQMPTNYDGLNPPHWILGTIPQELFNSFADHMADLLTDALGDVTNSIDIAAKIQLMV